MGLSVMQVCFFLPVWGIVCLTLIAAIVLSGFILGVATLWNLRDFPRW